MYSRRSGEGIQPERRKNDQPFQGMAKACHHSMSSLKDSERWRVSWSEVAWYSGPFLPVSKCMGRAGKGPYSTSRVYAVPRNMQCWAIRSHRSVHNIVNKSTYNDGNMCGNKVAPKEKRMLSSSAGSSVVCRALSDHLLNSSGAPSPSVCMGYLAQEPAVLCRLCFTTAKKYANIHKDTVGRAGKGPGSTSRVYAALGWNVCAGVD